MKFSLHSNHPETIIKYFVNTNTASGAGISFDDAECSERLNRHRKENTAVKKTIKRAERDAFEWLLHNLQNLKQPSNP